MPVFYCGICKDEIMYKNNIFFKCSYCYLNACNSCYNEGFERNEFSDSAIWRICIYGMYCSLDCIFGMHFEQDGDTAYCGDFLKKYDAGEKLYYMDFYIKKQIIAINSVQNSLISKRLNEFIQIRDICDEICSFGLN